MNGKDLLNELSAECFTIGHFKKIRTNYFTIQNALSEFDVIGHFSALKKIDGVDRFEICFFCNQFIHDITISPDACEHNIIKLSAVNSVSIKTDYDAGTFQLQINSNNTNFYYDFDQIKFEEINQIKNKIALSLIA
jgi:hypothetical protein